MSQMWRPHTGHSSSAHQHTVTAAHMYAHTHTGQRHKLWALHTPTLHKLCFCHKSERPSELNHPVAVARLIANRRGQRIYSSSQSQTQLAAKSFLTALSSESFASFRLRSGERATPQESWDVRFLHRLAAAPGDDRRTSGTTVRSDAGQACRAPPRVVHRGGSNCPRRHRRFRRGRRAGLLAHRAPATRGAAKCSAATARATGTTGQHCGTFAVPDTVGS